MAKNDTLVSAEEYLTAGVHIGTKFKNAYSNKYILKSRADGLKIIDTEQVDSKLNALITLVSKYEPSEIVVMGRRENVRKPIKMFSKLVGCDAITGRYLPGNLTNTSLDSFKEYKLVIICDPLTDKNILNEAFEQGAVIAGFCDTNNTSNKLDLVVPINNKGKKSMALAFNQLAKHYLVNKGTMKASDFKYSVDDFSDE